IIARAKLLQNRYQFEFPLTDRALEIQMGIQLEESIPNLEKVQVLLDDFPPPAYFGNLPSFNPAIARPEESRFCMCGSGKLQDDCHGKITHTLHPEVISPRVPDKKII
ncbi:MAG TPA: hypothetical protein VIQ31_13000, partial [Phormidium sp.]